MTGLNFIHSLLPFGSICHHHFPTGDFPCLLGFESAGTKSMDRLLFPPIFETPFLEIVNAVPPSLQLNPSKVREFRNFKTFLTVGGFPVSESNSNNDTTSISGLNLIAVDFFIEPPMYSIFSLRLNSFFDLGSLDSSLRSVLINSVLN